MMRKNISHLIGVLMLGIATVTVAQMSGDSKEGFERLLRKIFKNVRRRPAGSRDG